jgi:PAS domain S-box-containing protein
VSLPDAANADALYEDAPCGLLLTAHDGTLLRANRTFCRWLGIEAASLVGERRFQDLLSIGGRIFHQTHFQPLLQMQGSVSEVKVELVRGDGQRLPVMINAVRRPHGDTWHDELAVFIAKDRHAYERELMLARQRAEQLAAQHLHAQEALRQADRRKDEFLAMLAHELRNPLAPISTAAQLILMADGDTARLRPLGTMISRQAAHLTHLVDDLLDVSRVTRGLIELDRRPLDVATIVEAAVEQVRPLVDVRGHRLELSLQRGLAVEGDATRLVQVIANLVNNAAKYTPHGGRIDVTVEAQDGTIDVVVADDGLGIDATLLPHVFELFAQAERTPDRSQGGLGIGLSLVRSLVALHGGNVDAHSDGLHCGSRFRVRLPQAEAPPPAPIAIPEAVVPRTPQALQVLIVDDNEDAANTLAEVLGLLGHRTCVAHTAAAALAQAMPFDACILDIGLPDMSGHELAAALRGQQHPGVVYIALTGYGQPRDRVLSTAAGFDHHLVKPVDIARLAHLLGAIVPAHAQTA